MKSITVRSGFTGLWLLGSLVLTALLGELTQALDIDGENINNTVSVALLAVLFGLPAARWGSAMAHLHKLESPRRYGWAAGLAYGVTIGLCMEYLNHIEQTIQILMMRTDLEIHQLYTLLFVGVTAVSALVTGLALGAAARDARLALRLGLWGGLGAGLAFFLVTLVMDYGLGYQVGAPGAEQRATMITVTLVGMVVAAFFGSAAVGRALAGRAPEAAV
ncbi:MAG: hypothetical protein EPO32_12515 [Anaerolineae bacterium]|nr:MAG: hypothetical protein EPO32_12515 [Anaerolineae bacterium]